MRKELTCELFNEKNVGFGYIALIFLPYRQFETNFYFLNILHKFADKKLLKVFFSSNNFMCNFFLFSFCAVLCADNYLN